MQADLIGRKGWIDWPSRSCFYIYLGEHAPPTPVLEVLELVASDHGLAIESTSTMSDGLTRVAII